MPNVILTQTVASITELKTNPMATVNAGNGEAVAILNRNEPAFYCVPTEMYAHLLSLAAKLEQQAYKQEADAVLGCRLYQGEESVGATFKADSSKEDIEKVLFGGAL